MVQRRTTLRWIGVGAQSTIQGIQSTTVDPDAQLASEAAPEWLVTNGLGGYAAGTMTGLVTRRFHGYLVAALPAPRGRTMMLNNLRVIISTDEGRAQLSEQPDPDGAAATRATLREFRLELGIPVWTFEHYGHVIETASSCRIDRTPCSSRVNASAKAEKYSLPSTVDPLPPS
jgi:hypothetical protein